MKKILLFLALLLTIGITRAQGNGELSALLTNYYSIKNALVAGDAVKTANSAADFAKAINQTDVSKLSATDQKAFKAVQPKLVSDAKLIADAKDIAKQREVFAAFSTNMITLAKSAKLSDKEVYVDYCPMKKTYWLSAEQPIKNPYYGSSMLTCGSVKETIKQ